MRPHLHLSIASVFFVFKIGAEDLAVATQLGDDGHWPSFRGVHAAGAADGQNLPDSWDGAKATNIIWKT